MRRFVIPIGWVDDEAEKTGNAMEPPVVDVPIPGDSADVPAEPDEPEPPEQPSKPHHPKKPGRL